ncbi:hypothetical protein [Actinokineospora enzanensis]|uniref:hypothetical protein n=1 Tax=Actinokineospora enzanensis TaxID=155975 RepID=UPI0003781779|nr:hypothetical protein [Actinokineospora enzanensis]
MTRELITRLARSGVAEVAPGELPAFEAVAGARLDDSGRLRGTPRRGPDVLGSGLDFVVGAVSSGALVVAKAVVDAAAERTVDAAGGLLGRMIRKIRKRPTVRARTIEELAAELDDVRVELMRHRGIEAARRAGLTEQQAGEIVEAMLRNLRNS